MKFVNVVLAGLQILSAFAEKRNDSDPKSCKFTITSSGSLACPAGQLADGQIRLNGTYDIANFYIDENGGITDGNGRGCIVTEPPITQIQCDEGKEPAPGFSIGDDNTISYKDSSSFSACPATDTEYNIYVSPNFGQEKCVPIQLHASEDCGAPPPPAPPPPPPSPTCPPPSPASTVTETSVHTQWQTKVLPSTVVDATTLWSTKHETEVSTTVVTSILTQTSTTTTTCWVTQPAETIVTTSVSTVISSTCPIPTSSSTPSWNTTSTAVCHKCTETSTGWTTTTISTTTSACNHCN